MLRDNSDLNWNRIGKDNPYFGVHTAEKYRSENLTDDGRDEFLAIGESIVARFAEIVDSHLGAAAATRGPRRALDFGCGVGRLCLPLSRRYDEVVGIDISDPMLEEARANCRRGGVGNVTFHNTLDQAGEAGRFDLVLSYQVLQHMNAGKGMANIDKMIDLVKPGGVLAVHTAFWRHASPVRKISSVVRRNFFPANYLVNLLQGKPANAPLMQMNNYNLNAIMARLESNGIANGFFQTTRIAGLMGVMFFGRKDARQALLPDHKQGD